jgi:DnaJ-class molecular chaperone
MTSCLECGTEHAGDASVCMECAATDVVAAAEERGEEVAEWVTCPLCDGSKRCFFCGPGGPCYHCSGSGHVEPSSPAECTVCGGHGTLEKGCEICSYTRRCSHCGGTGRVPASVLRE